MTAKEAVRQMLQSRRAALSVADCEAWAPILTEQIVKLPTYAKAQTIMAYLAMPKEANLDGFIQRALADGKRVYVPLCVNKTDMIAVRLQHLDDVEYGVLHIRVPREPHEAISKEHIDLILVPGAGFDRYGGRMGMGNGYYDRFLQGLSPTQYVGVAWSQQILEEPIPMDEHDQRMPMVVTEQGVIEM